VSEVLPLHPTRRGPKPTSDAKLLVVIRADLAASPFTDEGHCKVWARLRILRDIRVSYARALRLMRENALLSPHRRPQGNPVVHDGSLQTDRPNEMWARTAFGSRRWMKAGSGSLRPLIISMPAVSASMPSRPAIGSPRCSSLRKAASRIWRHRRRCRSRPDATHGSRHAIHGRRLPPSGPVLGHRPKGEY
jgi:hypothetical protein